VFPTLPHPVKIELVQIDAATTPGVDPQFREPTGPPTSKAPIVLTAQLGLGQTDQYAQRPGGADPQSDGHVTLRLADLKREAPGVTLNIGDRVTKVYSGTAQATTTMPVNWSIVEVRPAGHYRGRGYTLLILFYRDMKTLARVVA
jgi:hypothetical protein